MPCFGERCQMWKDADGVFAKVRLWIGLTEFTDGALSIISRYPCDNSLANWFLSWTRMVNTNKTRIIDNVSSESIIQLLPMFCFSTILLPKRQILLESRSPQCSLHHRLGFLIDTCRVNQLSKLWQLIGSPPKWINCHQCRLYFPTLDPTAVTCSLSVSNIE